MSKQETIEVKSRMCNVWEEEYPVSLNELLKKVEVTAESILQKLNATNCPIVSDLYEAKDTINRKTNETVVKYFRKADLFEELKYMPNNYLSEKKKNKENEFKGLYIFGEEIKGNVEPVYIGISRTIFRRLKQHGWGQNHNECTLAYLWANHEYHKSDFKKGRKYFCNDELQLGRLKVQSFKVVLIPEPTDYDLYFMEVALAGILKTKWNSFKTH